MLSYLNLQNLILIQSARIELGAGLNIFTGETGSGKSAILTALKLLCGERADTAWIRSGSQMACVEAALAKAPRPLPDEIPLPPEGEPIHIRRELHSNGKSRIFIEDHLVNAATLREWIEPLIEQVDQSTSGSMLSSRRQRFLLDIFAGLEKKTNTLEILFHDLSDQKKKLQELELNEQNQYRDLLRAEENLRQIEETAWQKEEEEVLSQKHHLLTHAQELAGTTGAISEGISHLISHFRRLSQLSEAAAKLDSRLDNLAQTIKTCSLELDEADRFLHSYASQIEPDPSSLATIEARIAQIEALKKKFGPSWEDVEKQKEIFSIEIERLNSKNQEKATLEQKIGHLEATASSIAAEISRSRKEAADQMSHAILEELIQLNLPHAQFKIVILTKPLSGTGIDEITFQFSANPGLAPRPLAECASGGELSRLLLAVKSVLANKESVQCLVFDEIDGNVGGTTAAILGQKLKQLSEKRQVICVTHFVQVARFADRHFGVKKLLSDGRADTDVTLLSSQQRKEEYARMTGADHARL